MSRTKKPNTAGERFSEIDAQLKRLVPHLRAYLADEDQFNGFRIVPRPDGSYLAVAKRFGPDGGPEVCFGGGYGAAGALMAIDASIQGGNWRHDKPWGGKDG